MEGLTQAISTGALSVVVRPLGWSATHPISIASGRNSGVARAGFSRTRFFQVLDTLRGTTLG
jgi:hypothetical protein